MYADEPPRIVGVSQDVGGSELPIVGLTAVGSLLSGRLPGQPLPNVSPEHAQSRSRQPGKCQSNGGQAERDIEEYASLSERTGYDGIAAIVDDIPDGVCHEC